ncbi:hypothetical protein CKAN_02120000 [Cinnamomum micranthum f. kanehirae]|uniref:Uncharacterized protein n=1 Tax=Cinnamomum micranthum f. kanehirae TaxID=337451 RepID=A0A3S3QX71_9MAGN|nr:hypothetical protein CKAN_02120000 [Cinnamomum micranthum f. kanehirae]
MEAIRWTGCMWLRGRPFWRTSTLCITTPRCGMSRSGSSRNGSWSRQGVLREERAVHVPALWGWNESLCGYGGREASAPVRNLQPGQRFPLVKCCGEGGAESSSRVSPSFSP